MLPVPGVSTPTRYAPFIAPRNRPRQNLVDICRGGIAFNDAQRGLDYQDWTFTYNESSRIISASSSFTGVTVAVFTLPAEAQEIAGSFDTNMQPVIGWRTKTNLSFFRWFDPTVPGFTITQLAAGSRNVRIVLDDVRPGQVGTGATDTMITYVRSGTLYLRQLRDRFLVEYTLKSGIDGYRLGQFGMNRLWRLQWELY